MGVIHLVARDAINDITGAGSTFTSWGKCMAKSYCKWPVIVAIVVGSLIVLSVVFCLVRCLCCGLECCCGCFSCFNHCCPSPRRQKRSKYADPQQYQPNPYHGYQPAPYAPPAYEAPQFAQFETGSKGKVNEDSLPAMPSWDNAATRKVEDTSASDNLEMNDLNGPGQGLRPAAAAAGAGGPGGRGRYSPLSNPGSPHGEQPNPYGSTSPNNPYGGAGGQRGRGDYNYSRPSPAPTPSYGSQNSSAYGAKRTSPTYPQPPMGGYKNTASEDQFHPSAKAPTPGQYRAEYTGTVSSPQTAYSTWSGDSSTRYEPSTRFGQETGAAQASPPSPRDARPPSILQAGRKPVAGSWRDV